MSIEMSPNSLDAQTRLRLLDLALYPEDATVPLQALALRWYLDLDFESFASPGVLSARNLADAPRTDRLHRTKSIILSLTSPPLDRRAVHTSSSATCSAGIGPQSVVVVVIVEACLNLLRPIAA